MKHVISFSGGRTSAYLCVIMKRLFGDRVEIVFMDTGFEHPATYEFIKMCNEQFNFNITCLRGDYSRPLNKGIGYHVVTLSECKLDFVPFLQMMAKYGTPYQGGMFCSERLKSRPFKKYCDEKYGKNNYVTWLGIRADEPSRLKIGESPTLRYLAELSDFDKEDVLEWWGEQSFDLGIEEHLGNCVFCPKKSDIKLAIAARDEPVVLTQWINTIEHDDVRLVESRTQKYIETKGLLIPDCNNVLLNMIAMKMSKIMYRKNCTIEQTLQQFEGSTRDELYRRVRFTKMNDTGSCSESCEPLSGL